MAVWASSAVPVAFAAALAAAATLAGSSGAWTVAMSTPMGQCAGALRVRVAEVAGAR